MRKDKELSYLYAAIMTVLCLIIALMLVFMTDDTNRARELTSKAQQAIETCEKDLPRSQKCKVVISAEVVE